jgi:hypothetical protein
VFHNHLIAIYSFLPTPNFRVYLPTVGTALDVEVNEVEVKRLASVGWVAGSAGATDGQIYGIASIF